MEYKVYWMTRVHDLIGPETIDTARVGDSEFVLARHDADWIVRVDRRTLMSSRMHESEEALAEHAIDRSDDPQAVLVGGLGLGFTLRAVLDRVVDEAKVTVAELVPALVGWNAYIWERSMTIRSTILVSKSSWAMCSRRSKARRGRST